MTTQPCRAPTQQARRWALGRARGRIGTVAYRLALPPNMLGVHEVFHVSMIRKYTLDPAHVVDWEQIEVDTDGTFEEGTMCILDSRDKVLRRKTVRLVLVL